MLTKRINKVGMTRRVTTPEFWVCLFFTPFPFVHAYLHAFLNLFPHSGKTVRLCVSISFLLIDRNTTRVQNENTCC